MRRLNKLNINADTPIPHGLSSRCGLDVPAGNVEVVEDCQKCPHASYNLDCVIGHQKVTVLLLVAGQGLSLGRLHNAFASAGQEVHDESVQADGKVARTEKGAHGLVERGGVVPESGKPHECENEKRRAGDSEGAGENGVRVVRRCSPFTSVWKNAADETDAGEHEHSDGQ